MDLFNQGETGTHSERMQSSLRVGSLSHANRLVLQEQERVQKILDISGRKCLELSKQSARTTLLGRMCLDYLVLKGEWYLNRCALTWKAKATKSRRLYFQLVPQVHRTEEIESGLLLTPTRCEEVQDLDQFQKRMEKYPNGTKMPNLATQIQGLLATPQAMDIREDVRKPEERSEKANKGGCSNLRDAVSLLNQGLLLTPTSVEMKSNPKRRESRKEYRESIGRKGVPGCLTEQLGMMGLLPTTTKRNWKGGAKVGNAKRIGAESHEQHERLSNNYWHDWPSLSPFHSGHDGLSTELVRHIRTNLAEAGETPENIEAYIRKEANWLRKQAIMAAGNAVVPTVVLQVMKAIQNHYENTND